MSWLDSTWCAVSLYLLIFLLTLGLGALEFARGRTDASPSLWPTFWFVTAALVLGMALGRAFAAGQFLADLGRHRALSEGWYPGRRSAQARVVGVIALIWGTIVAVSIVRVPKRRRRCIPTALAIFTLVGYAGIRIMSLHQVDVLLYDRYVKGVSYGAIVELTLLLCTLLFTFLALWRSPAVRANP